MSTLYGAAPTSMKGEADVPLVNAGHDDDASKKSTSWRTRSLVGAAMLAVAAVAGVSAYRAYTAGPVPLSLEDWYSEDRCIVYTYNDGGGGGGELEAWKTSWAAAGWKPVVLNEQHARMHPKFDEYVAKFHATPKYNGDAYEVACYARHVAMAVIGGGLMTDNDVINVDVPPPPKCDTLPNNGMMTTHDDHVPSIISGSGDAFEAFVSDMTTTDWNVVMQATGQTALSDMIFTDYFARQLDVPKIQQSPMYHKVPNVMPDPPCDKNGEALPMIFHLSHDMMNNHYGGQDRAGTMAGEWNRLKDAVSQCQPATYDADSYEEHFWPVDLPAERRPDHAAKAARAKAKAAAKAKSDLGKV